MERTIQMENGIAEKQLKDFHAFEEWLDDKQLLDSNVLYRGHADSTWTLESTLYRHQRALLRAGHPDLDIPIDKYERAAADLQAIIETHTNRTFGNITASSKSFPITKKAFSFEYTVYLRHHGFPSPLLDWSLSPYVAAYFAFRDTADLTDTEDGTGDDGPHVAIYAMRPPGYPYKKYLECGTRLLPGKEAGIRYWPNPVKGETRHYDQQSAYTTALRASGSEIGVHFYSSHEYILRNFPQTTEDPMCWKITIPQRERESVLQRLDRMNINAYTLFRTEDTLVRTYGLRELRRAVDTT